MLARFFIDRPIFAWVISILIVGAGLVAMYVLPIAQYPEIAPPTVTVTCQYAGASATVVADTVAAPIEQQVNGVENMLYMSSQSSNDGTYTLTVTFKLGVNLDMAQVLVQNRVSLATPTLPDPVKLTGVTVKKKSPAILLVINLYSETDPTKNQPYYDQLYLSNYATINIKDQLARIDGVGDVTLLGQQDYSMRVWVDPVKLASRNLTANDVVGVLREQNVQVAAGSIGQPPVPTGQTKQYTMTTLGRLAEAEQFNNIILKTGTKGEVTYLKDVARTELGAKNQDARCFLDGKPSAGIAIYQLPGSNALDVGDRIKAKMKELQRSFPANLKYDIVYDTTPFVRESVNEVFNAIRDAIILVAVVVLIFLQDWKALMLPLIDVGVSLVGTLAILLLMGFSLNNLTLFGLVLAVGIVVDDAIVVLENIERWIGLGYKVREATIHAMDEITGPIIGITLVLSSVFLPSAFLPGISGQFYRQFALTIAASMVLSAINAMTMTPARVSSIFKDPKPGEDHGHHREALPWWGVAALFGYIGYRAARRLFGEMLGLPAGGGHGESAAHAEVEAWRLYGTIAALWVPGLVAGYFLARPVNRLLAVFFNGFNKVFDWVTTAYGWMVGRMLRLSVIVLLIYGGLLGLTYLGFTRIPTGFIPEQDKGYLIVNIQLDDAASLEQTVAVTSKVQAIAESLKDDGVAHTIGIPGMSILLGSNSSNYATMFITLKDFEHRSGHGQSAPEILRKFNRLCYAGDKEKGIQPILEARIAAFGAPPVDGLGSAGGFKLMVQDKSDAGLNVLAGQATNFAEKGGQLPGMAGMFNGFQADTPQLYVDVDRVKCKTLGVPLSDVFNTLQVFMGGYYTNDINKFGRTWQVNIQADQQFRVDASKVADLKVRNNRNEMIPLSSVAVIKDSSGPVVVTRYNMFPAAPVNGASLPGVSSGTVIKEIEELAQDELATGMGYEWTELTYMQILAGNTAIFAFIGAVILVFLVLAAQYESWSLPFAVILVVPMCLLSALAGIALAKMDMNIFVQIGFVVLVGLASKNAILVVEFARDKQKTGMTAFEATLEAGRVRLRPIIMTSFAFILGVVPLMIAHGAGAEMRRTLGTAVFWGMLGVTLFGLVLTPVFYYVVMWMTGGLGPTGGPPKAEAKPMPLLESSLPDGHGPAPSPTGIQPAPETGGSS